MRIQPEVNQGYAIYGVKSANSDNAAAIKATPGVVGGWNLINTTGSAVYVKLYDKATAPAPASDTPKIRIQIPANGQAFHPLGPIGWMFNTGIAVVMVTGAADTDDTAVAAGAILGAIGYA